MNVRSSVVETIKEVNKAQVLIDKSEVIIVDE